ELAHLLAAAHIDVVLVARSRDKLAALAVDLVRAHGVQAHVIAQDLALPSAPEAIVQDLAARGLPVDILINNAGFGTYGLFAGTPAEEESRLIQVNITALTMLTKLLLPPMLQRRHGRILNVASTAAFQPGPLMAVYYASKAYVLSFSEGIGNELKGTGVTVTALCPGPTRTGFATAAGMTNSNLFNAPGVMDAAPVAEAGYRGCMKGKAVVIPGMLNKVLVWVIAFSPRWMVTPISRRLQERKVE
ncbi:MAG TPA: SDR family oxidoreductase, partial [Gemmatimonadales bacterium]|nr:SDR family oxidoreductase [Gemmatimonadales bacterium]